MSFVREKWIASSRSLSSGAHPRDPLAPRNDGNKASFSYLHLQPDSQDFTRGGTTASRKKLITLPTAANPAPSASASVAPSRPARPKHNAASAAPMVWPVRRAVATMPLAPPLRSGGALDIRALMFGV